jgi:rhodanese-related sulfurtransferase
MAGQPGKILVDVRKPEELEEIGKIPHSINIPCKHKKINYFSSKFLDLKIKKNSSIIFKSLFFIKNLFLN